jgi:protein involved in polysaccharide export with SLBB domain
MIDGSIDLGRFGRIRVAGLTVEAIEDAIANQIASLLGTPERVNVQLIETNAAHVYVLGAVGSPGTYNLDGNETVLDAILEAGGLTSKASPCDIIMVRPTDLRNLAT